MVIDKLICCKKRWSFSGFNTLLFFMIFNVISLDILWSQDEGVKIKPTEFVPAIGLGLGTGSTGLASVDLAWHPVQSIGIRAGYNHLKSSFLDLEVNAANFGFADQNLSVDLAFNLGTAFLYGDYYPFKNFPLKLIGGIAIGSSNSISTTIRFTESMQLNDYWIEPQEIGTLTGIYRTDRQVYPYAGIGIGRSVPKKIVGFGFEFGAYHRGAPIIDILSDGLLDDNEHNGPILADNLSQINWHPNINLRLSVRLVSFGKPKKASTASDFSSIDIQEKESVTTVIESKPETPKKQAASKYVSIKGTILSNKTKEPLDHFYLNIFAVNQDGTTELVRTGRYLNGQFSVGLERGKNYKVRIEHIDFQRYESILALDHQFPKEVEHTYHLTPRN